MLFKARHLTQFCLALALLGTVTGQPIFASEKILHSFESGSDGAWPYDGLIADSAGDLYGTTNVGGGGNCQFGGCGTVFRLTSSGTETVLYSFQGGSDGAYPYGGLTFDRAGNLFGTTGTGGNCTESCGTVFKLGTDGTKHILYAFQGGSDGAVPLGTLFIDRKGNLYGVTGDGGSFNGSECINDGCGTVFELKADGTKVTLYTFQGGSDGAVPQAGLTRGSDGNFYGTTSEGGVNCDGISTGCGTVFKVTPRGDESVLYAFHGESDGYAPDAGLIVDKAGNFYGTTNSGSSCPSNPTFGCGTVFKVSPSGNETVLYSFQGGADGEHPVGGVVLDKAGNLYGTTYYGGGTHCKGSGCGTVFKLAPDGTETVLCAFYGKRGQYPEASLLLKDKKIYGTATQGGSANDGVVFSLNN